MKRGFTLIELLAVIVILAVIALIATPIVLNIIKNTRESAVLRSGENYLKAVEQAVARENMAKAFNPTSCTVISSNLTDNGVTYEVGDLDCGSEGKLKVDVNGTKPTGGTIAFTSGKIASVEGLVISKLNLRMDTNGKLVIEKLGLICTKISGTSKEIGSKYTCQVNSTTSYNFYVLSKDGSNINMIMDSNISSSNWGSVIGAGPKDALQSLYNATKDWNNIPNIVMNYTDEEGKYKIETNTSNSNYATTITTGGGYITGYETNSLVLTLTNLKARLIKKNELSNAYFIRTNLRYYEEYWTLSTATDSLQLAYSITDTGALGTPSINTSHYIRPVITISSTQLN